MIVGQTKTITILVNQIAGNKGKEAERDLEKFLCQADIELCNDLRKEVHEDLNLSDYSESGSSSERDSSDEYKKEFIKFKESSFLTEIELYKLDVRYPLEEIYYTFIVTFY
ncbi:hypothetical protein ACF0H5_001287 [Mactra antiquata]